MSSGGAGCAPSPAAWPHPTSVPASELLMTNTSLIQANRCCQVFGFKLSPAWARMLGFSGTVGERTRSQTMPGENQGPALCSAQQLR